MADDPFKIALDQLAAYGLMVESIDTSGKIRRVKTDTDKGSKKSGWYVAHEFHLDSGRTVITGRFGNWKASNEPMAFQFDASFTEEEKAKFKTQQAAQRAAADKETRARNRQAANRASAIWSKLPTEGHSPYLQRKKIHGFGCRYGRNGGVVVPVSVGDKLVGLQFIQPDGEKKFLTGTPKSGAYFTLQDEPGGPQIICTGYATGCSIAMAVPDATVLVCFDDGNLVTVAEKLVEFIPDLIIAADNDHAKPSNSGLRHAQQIVKKFGLRAVWPVFNSDDDSSDFNDLHVSQGLDAVAAVFNAKQAQQFPPGVGKTSAQKINPDDYRPPAGESLNDPGPQKSRGSSPTLGGVDGFAFSLESMLDNYAHVYGKTPQIFDKRARKLISPSTLHEIAEGAYKEWKKSPDRHIVDETNVVFDPSMTSDDATSVNLFGGFPLKPKTGARGRITDLLYYLVGENDQSFDWVLKWIALPLQKPGAKMRTAIVMHGTEGAGKNLFWNVIEQIYGEYSTIITQNEIESQFNGWASKKLFVIGNEVVSRQEMYHKKGIIKNMITEPEWLINDKNMPLRKEANHANFVFFSNVMQPVTPDPGDRRFMVIWTPEKETPEYYKAVVDEIKNGGVEAFYQFLLDLDLGDYTEWTEPVMTEAKTNLIDLSMRSDERFINRWKADDLPIPFQLCRTVDLYAAYQHWTRAEGEKFSVSKTEFLMRLSHDRQAEKFNSMNYLDGTSRKRTAFIGPVGAMERKPENTSREKYAGAQYEGFLDALNEWKGVQKYAE